MGHELVVQGSTDAINSSLLQLCFTPLSRPDRIAIPLCDIPSLLRQRLRLGCISRRLLRFCRHRHLHFFRRLGLLRRGFGPFAGFLRFVLGQRRLLLQPLGFLQRLVSPYPQPRQLWTLLFLALPLLDLRVALLFLVAVPSRLDVGQVRVKLVQERLSPVYDLLDLLRLRQWTRR